MRVVQMNPSSPPPKERIAFPPPPPHPPSPALHPKAPFDIRSFRTDDWILLSIIAILILEGSDDYLLLCALGYLFLMGL